VFNYGISKFVFTKNPVIEADSETIICLPSSYPFKSRRSNILGSFDIESVISGLLSVQQETKNGINPRNSNIIAAHSSIFATAIHLFVVIYSFVHTSVSGISKLKFNSCVNILFWADKNMDRIIACKTDFNYF
jgi:hypothetical protein